MGSTSLVMTFWVETFSNYVKTEVTFSYNKILALQYSVYYIISCTRAHNWQVETMKYLMKKYLFIHLKILNHFSIRNIIILTLDSVDALQYL